jgi:hypothetical protein
MMTKVEWDRQESMRLALAELLNQEPLKQALEVCISLETEIPQHFSGGADLLHQAALSGCAREGYFRFLRNLKSLTKEPLEQRELSEPWAHLKRNKSSE